MSAFLVLSDIHANYEALWAVFQHAERAHGTPDAIWCLGDIVGYGPDPGPCIDLLLEKRRTSPLLCIRGNHDEGTLQAGQGRHTASASQALNQSWRWSYGQLAAGDPARLDFLRSLPMLLTADAAPQPTLLVHAAPDDPLNKYLTLPSDVESSLDTLEQRLCFFGHTHLACYFLCDPQRGEATPRLFDSRHAGPVDIRSAKAFINPGAIGQPRWGRLEHTNGKGMTYQGVREPSYLWVELAPDRCRAWCHFVSYNPESTIQKLRALKASAAGLDVPDRWIKRLREGLR